MSTRATTTATRQPAHPSSTPQAADLRKRPTTMPDSDATEGANLTPDIEQAFANQLVGASEARELARSAFVETVRDALDAGLSEGQIAKILKINARSYIYKMRRDATAPANATGSAEDDNDGEPKRTPLQPVIFLRGAGVPNPIWVELQQLCWARQWATTTKRGDAWHLTRGGAPVIFVDFSKRSADDLKVAGVRAVYRGAQQKEVLELINGGSVPRPQLADGTLDTAAVTVLIQEVLGDLPAVPERRRLAAFAASSTDSVNA